jgi:hypothetical protein
MQTKEQRHENARFSSHLTSRFNVDGSRRGLYECPNGGIVLDASRIELGDADLAVVLVTDLAGMPGGRNCEMSASNAFATIAGIYWDVILKSLGVDDILWIEQDSMGCFDRVLVDIAGNTPSITWQPLLSGAFPGRTEDDFIALFGQIAERALKNACDAVLTTGVNG